MKLNRVRGQGKVEIRRHGALQGFLGAVAAGHEHGLFCLNCRWSVAAAIALSIEGIEHHGQGL